jgi:hypothetical protein
MRRGLLRPIPPRRQQSSGKHLSREVSGKLTIPRFGDQHREHRGQMTPVEHRKRLAIPARARREK